MPGYPDDPAAFRRAFERDKETLREMGVPIQYDDAGALTTDEPGYHIPKDEYYLRDPALAPDELAALHLAASVVRLEGGDGLEAFWKLGGAPSGEASAPVASLPGADHLVPLFTAVSERRRASFDYHDRRREVEPQGLAFRNGHWYLSARDAESGEDRSWRLDRIQSPVELGEDHDAYARSDTAAAPEAPWRFGGDEPVVAELLVDADQAGWAVHHLGEHSVKRRLGDGAVVLAVPVTNREAFRSFVLGFLDHAEVLSPPELREGVVAWLERLAG